MQSRLQATGLVIADRAGVAGNASLTAGSGTAPSAQINMGYDAANRLVTFQSPTTNASYTYDGSGLRMSKTVDGNTTHFAWGESGSLPMLLDDGTNSYIYGPGGTPIEQISNSGSILYYHHDQIGSTRVLTDASGSVAATYSYDVYGNPVGATGSTSTPLIFSGEYRDAESGLIYLRARYYDPSTGQFLPRDPAVSSTRSPYAYVAGNPLNATDPTGETCWPFWSSSCGIDLPFGTCINNGSPNCQGFDLPGGMCEAHNNPNCSSFIGASGVCSSVSVVNAMGKDKSLVLGLSTCLVQSTEGIAVMRTSYSGHGYSAFGAGLSPWSGSSTHLADYCGAGQAVIGNFNFGAGATVESDLGSSGATSNSVGPSVGPPGFGIFTTQTQVYML